MRPNENAYMRILFRFWFVFFVGGTQLTVHTIFSPDLTHSYVATTTQISYPPPKKNNNSRAFLFYVLLCIRRRKETQP